ncbi:MAG TPA: DedA family protein [Bacteroidales bacterium]|jgi:membrane-associated protein|nr:DedA family protein [Bacteroidales bacterium]
MSDLFHFFIDFILHIDQHLVEIVTDYRSWTYAILFLIIFCETGLVITPFLPGDSLLFAAGAVAAMDGNPLNILFLVPLCLSAAFIGDNTNYAIGRYLGTKVYDKNYKLIKRKYLDQTHAFYEKHGGVTLVIARFMPIIRTFAPFVAGVGTMKYRRFLMFCIIGNLLWVNIFSFAGYFFGNIPFVKENFSLVVLAIIFVSFLPPMYAFLKQLFKKTKTI